MKFNLFKIVAISWFSGFCMASAAAQDGPSVSTPVSALAFAGTGMKDATGEVTVGAAFGNMAMGKHGTFVRYPAGYVTHPHTHTEYYYAVVVKGTVVNTHPGEKDIPLEAGSYWFQKAAEVHITKCVSKEPCLFFINMPGKFVHTNVDR